MMECKEDVLMLFSVRFSVYDVCYFFILQDFQNELDSRYDKHERIVKLSRDTTIHSKRIIFLLHRCSEEKKTEAQDNGEIFIKAEHKLTLVKRMLGDISKELRTEDPARFHRAYTNGVQEFIEALSFYFYLKEDRLIPFHEAKEWMTFSFLQESNKGEESDIISFPLTILDYALGIADLTGEIMRLTVNAVGAGNWSLPFTSLNFMRSMQRGFQSLIPTHSEVTHKLQTLNQSLFKIEKVCYEIKLRGSENISRPIIDLQSNDFNNDIESIN